MRIGIVGGGILGMNLAKLCRRAGHEVVLVEAEAELGGLLRSIQVGGVALDRFYHVINPTDTLLLDLITELGLQEQLQWRESQTGFYANGSLHAMNNIIQFLTFSPLDLYERFRLGLCVVLAGWTKNWESLQDITAAAWLTKLAGRRVMEKVWKPLLQSKFAEYWDKVNAAYMWGTINRYRAARKGVVQKEALGCIRGGYTPFLKAMTAHLGALGVDVRTNTAVQRITTAKSGEILLDCRNAEGEICHFTFNKVVSTLPQSMFDKLVEVPGERRTEFDTLGIIEGLMLLKRPLSPYYVINITDRTVPFTGIIEYTNVANADDYDGFSIVFISRYVDSKSDEFDFTENNIKSYYLENIKKMFPHYDFEMNMHNFRIMKTKYLQPVHDVQYGKRIPAIPTCIKNVYSVNSVHINPWPVFSNEALKLSCDVFETYFREYP
jgi:protoporphyrinogen oxidase